jgi:hypothetical protein
MADEYFKHKELYDTLMMEREYKEIQEWEDIKNN